MVGFDPIYLMRSKLQNSFEAYYASGTGSKPTNNKYRIAETTQGNLDNTEAKIFDTNGKYVRHLRPFTGPASATCHVLDLDIDKGGNIYLLVREDDDSVSCYVVFIFEKDCSFHGSFQLRNKYSCFKLASRGVKTDVLVMNKQNGNPHSHSKIEVYETKECKFVSSFGGRILMDAKDLVCDGKGNTFCFRQMPLWTSKELHSYV